MARVIACPDCDSLQRESELARGGTAACVTCGAILYSVSRRGLDHTLAYALAAGVVLACAIAVPVAMLDAQGARTSTTVFGIAQGIYQADMPSVATLVFVTLLLMPTLEIVALVYLLLPLELGRVPRHAVPMLRVLRAAQRWGMVDVFILGALVAISKVQQIATVSIGAGLWLLAVLMLLMAAANATFDERTFWARMPARA